MKFRNIVLFIVCFFMAVPANATTVLVQSCERYSTRYPKRNVSVKVVEPALLKNGTYLEKDAVIYGKIIEVVNPKRGKRNAYFVFVPSSYTVPSVGAKKTLKRSDIETKLVGYKKLNKKEAAIKTGVSAGGMVVPGFSQAYWFGRGATKPVKGKTRLSSGVYTVYKNSPFVYVEEGDELVVKKGTYLKMKFYYANKPTWQFWNGV